MTKANRSQWTCTDNTENYLSACAKAAEGGSEFSKFRANPYIGAVVETRPAEWAESFLSAAEKSGVSIGDAIVAAGRNDSIGSPTVGQWRNVLIAGTTAAYICEYAQLMKLFGSLNGLRICEVGVGYAGLCSIIMQMQRPKQYNIYDMPEVLSLAQKYLTVLGHDMNRIPFHDRADSEHYDLFISSCAYSELNNQGQQDYADLIRNAERGFITWSATHQSEPWAHDVNQVLDRLKSIVPSIRFANDIERYREHFSWWGGNTYVWGV